MAVTLNVAGTQTSVNTLKGVKGITRQYQKSATNGSQNIKGRDSGNVTVAGQPGTYKTGAGSSVGGTGTGIGGTLKLVDGTIQNSTDPLVVASPTNNAAANFLPSTPAAQGSGNPPTVNAAQAASAGKSLSPSHE